MSFDLSRVTFNSWNDFLGAVMLQGRPQLDSDWNDQQAEVLRRIQVGTLDAIGQAVYPAALPNSFAISASVSNGVNQILIGAGRMYVDGILAENHGPAGVSAQGDPVPTSTAQWDTSLAELSNSYVGAPYAAGAVPFNQQPYYPPGTPSTPLTMPTTNGPFLVYLDVWQRAATYIEKPNLVDKAVAVDTTGRLQTVWQVKFLDVSSVTPAVTCATPLSSIPAWVTATQSSAGGLSTNVYPSPVSGPCCLTAATGYTGQESQLYRVEIHQGGPLGTATFKWSRENASVMTGVTAITTVTNTANVTASQLTVQSMGRDQVLGFQVGDWIEILDDTQDFNGVAGFLHMIDSISLSAKTITLDSTVDTATVFPTGAGGKTDPTRHTRIRRWDQSGVVSDTNGNQVANVGVAGGAGDIPIQNASTVIVLENGVTVQFNLNPTNGVFLPGDYWNFAARASDGSVEILSQAPPLGIHHHYTLLSVVTFPSTASNCRIEWPQPCAGNGGCGCTLIIGPSDVTATTTLQQILIPFMGLQTKTVICLQPGTYNLAAPLMLTSAHSNITLEACLPGTAILQAASNAQVPFPNGLIVLNGANSFKLSGLKLLLPTTPFAGATFAGLALGPNSQISADVGTGVQSLAVSIGVRPINCSSLTITECDFSFPPSQQEPNSFGAAVFAGGSCSGLWMKYNRINARGLFAGFLMTPSVAFAPPHSTLPPWYFGPGRVFPLEEIEAVTKKAAPKLTSKKKLQIVSEVKAPLANEISEQEAANFSTFAAPTNPDYAANGGSVLASTLNNAVFEGNWFGNLTFAALIVGESNGLDFTDNEVEGCVAGLWLLAPSMAAMVAMDPQNLALIGLTAAMGYPLPTGVSYPTPAIPAAPAAIRVYTGTENFTDDNKFTWQSEKSATNVLSISGGELRAPDPALTITNPLPDASDARLYQSERYGVFAYTFKVPDVGFYQVTLKFAEIVFNASQQRVFDVSINGHEVLSEFDIFSDVANNASDDKVFSNVTPVDGEIKIAFTQGENKVDLPKISAVQIEPQWDGLIPNPYFSEEDDDDFYSGESQNFFAQLTQLGQQGFAGLATAPLRLRLDDNEMTGLTSAAFLILWDDQAQKGRISSMMMGKNRLDTTNVSVPFRTFYEEGAGLYFSSVAAIALVTRGVVSGNMLLNEGQATESSNKDQFNDTIRVCLILDADGEMLDFSASNETAVAGPVTELAVAGNVLQGVCLVSPEPVPSTKITDLNSVTS